MDEVMHIEDETRAEAIMQRWHKEQRDREVESLKEFDGRLRHARACAEPEQLLKISEERWAEPVAIVMEEREIAELRRQLGESQGMSVPTMTADEVGEGFQRRLQS